LLFLAIEVAPVGARGVVLAVGGAVVCGVLVVERSEGHHLDVRRWVAGEPHASRNRNSDENDSCQRV